MRFAELLEYKKGQAKAIAGDTFRQNKLPGLKDEPYDTVGLEVPQGEYELDIDQLGHEEQIKDMIFNSGLTKQEQFTLWSIYYKDATEADVAKALNISAGRIHQVHAKALRKLRHPSRSDKFRPYVEEDQK